MTNRVLLTGAGFSRNWGGWLGAEVFEFLLSAGLSRRVRDMMWQQRRRGFEYVLGRLQHGVSNDDRVDARAMNDALVVMFQLMNSGFTGPFDPPGTISVSSFLGQFDAIFTLNQDCLIETKYNGEFGLGGGWYRPGLKAEEPMKGLASLWHVADPDNFWLKKGQPYVKLHGSSDVRAGTAGGGGPMLIQGSGKGDAISSTPLLAFYQQCFRTYLARPDTRLMVIGYSFGDPHINELILEASKGGQLTLFVVDPRGIEVLDQNEPGSLSDMDPNADLVSYVRGASRRNLLDTFGGGNTVELARFSRFLA